MKKMEDNWWNGNLNPRMSISTSNTNDVLIMYKAMIVVLDFFLSKKSLYLKVHK
jgi:hypothetical protein